MAIRPRERPQSSVSKQARRAGLLAAPILLVIGILLIVLPTSTGRRDTDATNSADRPLVPPTLTPIDGGTGYYGQFSSSLPTDPGFFPIGVWGAYALTQSNIDLDKSIGLNTYVWMGGNPAEDSALARLRGSGMYAMHFIDQAGSYPSHGSESVGWITEDEIDMQQANPAGAATARTELTSRLSRRPDDGRFAYSNYGKGVIFWLSDSDAEQFVNDYQQVVSNDIYWFADNDSCVQSQGGNLFGLGRNMTRAECKRASNYGRTVDRMRSLDAMDGARQPIWNFVEVGHPFSNESWPSITAPQIRAAVWHSIIAGARGILYFQHNFGGPCISHHALRDNCGNVRPTVTATNEQIKQLAPVLNSPSVTSGWSANANLRAMVKWDGQNFYVFAGSKENAATTGTFAMSCLGNATATRLGESGSVTVTNGSFNDFFADGNAVHIYRIDGGSSCGL